MGPIIARSCTVVQCIVGILDRVATELDGEGNSKLAELEHVGETEFVRDVILDATALSVKPAAHDTFCLV